MNVFSYYTNQLTNQFDNGRFFREPMRVFYIICGVVSFIVPAGYLFWLFNAGLKAVKSYNGWPKFTTITALILIAILLISLALLAFFYWKRRSDDLKKQIRIGDNYVGLPVLAHFIKCAGESIGALLFLGPIGSSIIIYITGLLSGFSFAQKFDGKTFIVSLLLGILGIIVQAIIQFLISYLIILISRVWSEALSAKAQIANDLRDTSDIIRAGAMAEEK